MERFYFFLSNFFDKLQVFFSNPLNIVLFIPLLGMIVVLFIPKENAKAIRLVSFFSTLLPFLYTLHIVFNLFVPSITDTMQLTLSLSWIPQIGVSYFVGVDGLAVSMLVLTTFVSCLAMIGSWGIDHRVKEYFALFLLLVFGMLGVFVSLDFFLFYVFWEIMLVPMYFLIGIWGGPRKEYAAIKFFLYTLFGSVFMLIAILALYFYSGSHSFSMFDIARAEGFKVMPLIVKNLCFLGFFLSFAIKVPMFPFHTWLPDAHVEAPTAISVILAGVLLKMGGYGFLRFSYYLLPESARYFAPFIGVLAVISIIYGALVSMAQEDLKKLIAYSSVSHMGYVMLGIAVLNTDGFNGAVWIMLAHGFTTGALFLLVGVLYDRAHVRIIDAFGGLGNRLPVYTFIMTLFTLASLGLPGLMNFIGEFLSLKAAFTGSPSVNVALFRTFAVLGAIGLIITAGYLLWMLERIFLGKLNEKWANLSDMDWRELASLVPLALAVVFFGVYPAPMMNLFNEAMQSLSRLYAG